MDQQNQPNSNQLGEQPVTPQTKAAHPAVKSVTVDKVPETISEQPKQVVTPATPTSALPHPQAKQTNTFSSDLSAAQPAQPAAEQSPHQKQPPAQHPVHQTVMPADNDAKKTPMTPSEIAEANTIRQKRGRGFGKLAATFGIGLIIAVVLGGSAMAYNFFVVLPNTPDNFVARGLGNLLASDADAADTYLDYSVRFKNPEITSSVEEMSLGLDISTDIDEETSAAALEFKLRKINMKFGGDLSAYSFDAEDLKLNAEIRLIGSRMYGRYSGVESIREPIESLMDAYYSETRSASQQEIQEQVDLIIDELKSRQNQWYESDTGGEDLNLNSQQDGEAAIRCVAGANESEAIQKSISYYYYTNMQNVFVGILCAVALFLFAYTCLLYTSPSPRDA